MAAFSIFTADHRTRFMTVDSHQHFWRYNPQRDGWITDEMSLLKRDFLPDDLVPELRANAVDGCVAVQADQSEEETLFLLNLAKHHDEILGVVGWADLCAPDISDRLHYFSQFEKLCGFRHVAQAEPDDHFLLRADFVHGIGCLTESDFTYDILIYPRQLPVAIELAAKFPTQRFVLDHMAKPSLRAAQLKPWAKYLAELGQSLNVYCKVSGLVTEADWNNWRPEAFRPYLDVAMEAFGPDRLMFGSDWPVSLLAGSYRDVKELVVGYTRMLSREKQDRIFGLNALDFYKLNTLRRGLGANGPGTKK
jgi:L-fuconolactonase